jgi:DnaJ-class molecular chaperone
MLQWWPVRRRGAPTSNTRRWSGEDDVDLFAELFGARSTRTRVRESDVHYTFSVKFTEAISGAKKRVVMAKRSISGSQQE